MHQEDEEPATLISRFYLAKSSFSKTSTGIDRISTGAKPFIVAVGLVVLLAYSFENQPITRPYQPRTSTPPWMPSQLPPHVTVPPALPTPAPFETPFSPAQAPSVGPTVEVRRALPPDVKLPTLNSTTLPATPSYPTPHQLQRRIPLQITTSQNGPTGECLFTRNISCGLT